VVRRGVAGLFIGVALWLNAKAQCNVYHMGRVIWAGTCVPAGGLVWRAESGGGCDDFVKAGRVVYCRDIAFCA
jgi:hypothetical protein